MNQHFIKRLNLTTTLQKTEDRERSEQSWMVERPFHNKEQVSWANREPGSSNNDRERDFQDVSTSFHLIHNQPSIFQMQKPQVQTAGLTMPFVFFLTYSCFVLFWPCSLTWGILVPWPEMEPEYPALGAWSLHHWTTGKVLCHFTEGTWPSEVWIRRRSWNQPFMDTELGLYVNFPLTFYFPPCFQNTVF